MPALTREQVEVALAEVAAVADLRLRAMMGGWLVYADGVLIGQYNRDGMYVKATAFGEQFAPDLIRESPYEGARPALLVPHERFADGGWLHTFITGTRDALAVRR